jgi:AbrB family looped-hinge helix DNA binding protein
MDEIVAISGRTQYNTLKKLQGHGYRIRKLKEGGGTRYFAEPPNALSFDATVTSNGQVTIPKAVRETLGLRAGGKVRFTFEDGNRVHMAPAGHRLSDLFGILGKPPRSVTLEQMDEAIGQAAAERHARSKR